MPDCAGENRIVTAGARIHNELTYRVVDWLLNSAVGVTFAYWTARTQWGRALVTKPATAVFRRIVGLFSRDEKVLEEGSKWGGMIISIMAGGTAIIPVMMKLEDPKFKKGFVHWWDEKIYGKERVATDPKFAECHDAIEDEPRKHFWDGMASRFMALTPLIIVTVTPSINKHLVQKPYKWIGESSKWLMTRVGIRPTRAMADPLQGALEHIEGDPNIPKRMQSNWDFLHATIGFDFGLTIAYSILHELSYKALASWQHGRKKNAEAAQPESAPKTAPEPLPEKLPEY